MGVRGAVAALVGFVVLAEACSSASVPEPVGTSSSKISFGSTWVPLGNGLINNAQGWDGSNGGRATGRVSVIAANPMNPKGDVWVGAGSGGLWHGAVGGPWTPMLDSLSPESIGAIKLKDCNSTRCNTVWVGTGESSIRRDTYYGSGVYVGRWNGSSYSFSAALGATTFANGAITALAVNPTGAPGSETVYVALSSGETTSATDGTLETTPTRFAFPV